MKELGLFEIWSYRWPLRGMFEYTARIGKCRNYPGNRTAPDTGRSIKRNKRVLAAEFSGFVHCRNGFFMCVWNRFRFCFLRVTFREPILGVAILRKAWPGRVECALAVRLLSELIVEQKLCLKKFIASKIRRLSQIAMSSLLLSIKSTSIRIRRLSNAVI